MYTKRLKCFVNASNIHVGGGAVLLNDFIRATKLFEDTDFIIYVDPRFNIPKVFKDNIFFFKIRKILRWTVTQKIEKQTEKNDIDIYLTNLPPIINHKCKTILYLQNRFIVDSFSLSGFSIKTSLRINIERLLFRLSNENTNYIIVQSESMYSILKKKGIDENKIRIIAYKNKEDITKSIDPKTNFIQLKNSFLYVSSDDPHKNHKKLIEAWCLLSNDSIYPKLIITININTDLHRFVMKNVEKYKLDVEIKPRLKRREIIDLYSQSPSLIYPSLLESYGLPLIEASQYGLPVLAAELDYVRDIMDPVETFDPHSAKSISRAVKRYLKISNNKTLVVTPTDFIRSVIDL